MTIGRRRGAAAALLLVAGVLMSACSDDPEPELAPPPTSPSATEPVAEPVKEPWERKTKAGAVAFLNHWVNTLNEAGRTGATGHLAEISAPSCNSCSNLIEYINDAYTTGGRIEGNGWQVLDVSQIPPTVDLNQPTIAARVRQSSQTVYRPGEEPTHVERSTATITFALTWQDRWLASDAEVQS